LIGCLMRATRILFQASRPVMDVTVNPFVASLAADVIQFAQLSDAEHFAQVVCDKLSFLIHS